MEQLPTPFHVCQAHGRLFVLDAAGGLKEREEQDMRGRHKDSEDKSRVLEARLLCKCTFQAFSQDRCRPRPGYRVLGFPSHGQRVRRHLAVPDAHVAFRNGTASACKYHGHE